MAEANKQPVGHVEAVYRYPVKSMRGERMEEAPLSWYGVDGDRRYAFTKVGNTSGFPWLTGRDIPEIVLYAARYVDPEHPLESQVVVATPAGREMTIDRPELLDELAQSYGRPAHLMFLKKGCHDAMPVSLLGVDSVKALGAEAGIDRLDPRRFRPNLLVRLTNGAPFGEESWIDHALAIGEGERAVRMRVNRRNGRCAMTNIDPDSGERDPRVLKTVTQMRDQYIGVYASVETPGTVCPGDPIYLAT